MHTEDNKTRVRVTPIGRFGVRSESVSEAAPVPAARARAADGHDHPGPIAERSTINNKRISKG
eukprot:scaffold5920_cov114-Isochrysis_galbana.AAC.1